MLIHFSRVGHSLTSFLLIFFSVSSTLVAQTTFFLGTGIEFNTVHDPSPGISTNTFELVRNKPGFFIQAGIEKHLGRKYNLGLNTRFLTLEHEGGPVGGIVPLDGRFGYHKLSVQPNFSKCLGKFQVSVGVDISFLLNGYIRYVNTRSPNDRDPFPDEGFNIQYGPRIALAYKLKKLLFQLDGAFGLGYSDEEFYEFTIDTANYYGLSVQYSFMIGNKK